MTFAAIERPETSVGVISSRPKKRRCIIPAHTVLLRALFTTVMRDIGSRRAS